MSDSKEQFSASHLVDERRALLNALHFICEGLEVPVELNDLAKTKIEASRAITSLTQRAEQAEAETESIKQKARAAADVWAECTNHLTADREKLRQEVAALSLELEAARAKVREFAKATIKQVNRDWWDMNATGFFAKYGTTDFLDALDKAIDDALPLPAADEIGGSDE